MSHDDPTTTATRDDALIYELARQMDGPRRWYLVLNDLIGGWSVGNRDRPQSTYDYRRGDAIVADFMDEDDATAVAALLNLHGYVPKRWAELQPAASDDGDDDREGW
jgi:hypothetical protein